MSIHIHQHTVHNSQDSGPAYKCTSRWTDEENKPCMFVTILFKPQEEQSHSTGGRGAGDYQMKQSDSERQTHMLHLISGVNKYSHMQHEIMITTVCEIKESLNKLFLST